MSAVSKLYFLSVLMWLLMIIISSCATPVAPSGGEPDRTGPVLVSTYPETGTVNYRERFVRFVFEDYVDRASFQRALRIEPDINVPFEVSWRRRTATVNLLRPLPDTTTVIFRISTDLRDTNGNALRSSETLALSTGPDIDSGALELKVRPLYKGMNMESVAVMLYREPFEIERPARYVGFPDTSGAVQFNYLSPGSYTAFILNDMNRNRTWESQREFAQPVGRRLVLSDEQPELDLGTFWYARRDTTPVRVESVGLLSNQRLRIRFSRAIDYKPFTEIRLIDAETADTIKAGLMFMDDLDENVGHFFTVRALNEDNEYKLDLMGLRDRNSIRIRSLEELIEGSSDPDTAATAFMVHLTERGIRPREPHLIAYTNAIEHSDIPDSLQIFRNRENASQEFDVTTWYNLLRIKPSSGRWNDSDNYEIRTWNPETARFVSITTRLIRDADLGDLAVSIADSTLMDTPMHVRVYDDRGNLKFSSPFTGNITLEDLPSGSFKVVVFEDVEGSGFFNPGSVRPWVEPARIYVNQRTAVRARMTSELDVLFD